MKPNNSALFGSVEVAGRRLKIIVPGRDIGPGCAEKGAARFFTEFIAGKIAILHG